MCTKYTYIVHTICCVVWIFATTFALFCTIHTHCVVLYTSVCYIRNIFIFIRFILFYILCQILNQSEDLVGAIRGLNIIINTRHHRYIMDFLFSSSRNLCFFACLLAYCHCVDISSIPYSLCSCTSLLLGSKTTKQIFVMVCGVGHTIDT